MKHETPVIKRDTDKQPPARPDDTMRLRETVAQADLEVLERAPRKVPVERLVWKARAAKIAVQEL